MCWYTVMQGYSVEEPLNVPSGFQQISLPHLCGATITPFTHTDLNRGPDMGIYQGGFHELFSYRVTNSTLSLNQIAARQICDLMRSTFLTSLGDCGCVELWNNTATLIEQPSFCAKENHPMQRRPVHNAFTKETLCFQIVQCLLRGRGRNCAIILQVKGGENGLPHIFI